MRKYHTHEFFDKISKEYAGHRLGKKDSYLKKELIVVRKHIPKNTRILDVCCGPGLFLTEFARTNDVTGIDISSNLLSIAKSRLEKADLKCSLKRLDARDLSVLQKKFDSAIMMGDSLGVVDDPYDRELILREIRGRLKKDSKLIVTIGNRNSSLSLILKTLSQYVMNIADYKYGTIEYIYDGEYGLHYNYSISEFERLARKTGYSIVARYRKDHKLIYVLRA